MIRAMMMAAAAVLMTLPLDAKIVAFRDAANLRGA